MSKTAIRKELALQAINSARGGAGSGYVNEQVKDEFVAVEILWDSKKRCSKVVIALKPPHPCREFDVKESEAKIAPTDMMAQRVMGDIRKKAAELRWECIETLLAKDIEEERLDRMRMVEFLEKTLDNETREWLAAKLMERVEVVPR